MANGRPQPFARHASSRSVIPTLDEIVCENRAIVMIVSGVASCATSLAMEGWSGFVCVRIDSTAGCDIVHARIFTQRLPVLVPPYGVVKK
jgi:hypothetical protein